jgi:hypothetical protein
MPEPFSGLPRRWEPGFISGLFRRWEPGFVSGLFRRWGPGFVSGLFRRWEPGFVSGLFRRWEPEFVSGLFRRWEPEFVSGLFRRWEPEFVSGLPQPMRAGVCFRPLPGAAFISAAFGLSSGPLISSAWPGQDPAALTGIGPAAFFSCPKAFLSRPAAPIRPAETPAAGRRS